MLDLHDDSFIDRDATLERLRHEVTCLSVNLGTMADRPESSFTKARFPTDDHVGLAAHFSYEQVDPVV